MVFYVQCQLSLAVSATHPWLQLAMFFERFVLGGRVCLARRLRRLSINPGNCTLVSVIAAYAPLMCAPWHINVRLLCSLPVSPRACRLVFYAGFFRPCYRRCATEHHPCTEAGMSPDYCLTVQL